MIRLIITLLGCLAYSYAISCTCFTARKVSVEALLYDGLVFRGNIIALDTVYGEYKNQKYPEGTMATFKVDTWVSAHDVSDTLTVYTGVGGGDCGLPLSIGETWLIYTREHDGIQSTSICTPSMKMKGKTDKDFAKTWKYITKLKSSTGYVSEEEKWNHGPYTISGNVESGKPVGQWVRIRENDTIAVFNFNDQGKRQGHQMERDEDYDETFESAQEVTATAVKKSSDFYGKTFRSIYELKGGMRHGKFEIYWGDELHLKATYKNGKLHGEYVTWHEDQVIATGKIKTVNQFEHGKLLSSIRFDEAGNVIKY
jgi:antitoxin component YwqK of YwqJK toxin-antitoxin module